jgi:hypothetical protein
MRAILEVAAVPVLLLGRLKQCYCCCCCLQNAAVDMLIAMDTAEVWDMGHQQ